MNTLIKNTCIFVSSSDNTFDIFSKVFKNLPKKISFNLDLYVGLNKSVAPKPFKTIQSEVCGWQKELRAQILTLDNRIEYIILLLDDFYVYEFIGEEDLAYYLDFCKENHVDYLRLKKLERSLIVGLFRKFINRGLKVIKIDNKEPYFSSLQIAIWKKDYLIEMLDENGSIWDFEHRVQSNSNHFAVTEDAIKYEHLVEKGKWLLHSKKILKEIESNQFMSRGYDQRYLYKYKFIRGLGFKLYGYTLLKLKKILKVYIDE